MTTEVLVEPIESVDTLETTELEVVIETETVIEVIETPAEQGPPGRDADQTFDLNLDLIYQTAKL